MLALAFLACNGDSPEGGPTGPGPTGGPTSPPITEPTGPTDPPAVTFHQDVAPKVAASCARCHNPTGFGSTDFLDYGVASAWAEAMLAQIDAGQMPPPAADPDCYPYQDAEVYQIDPDLRDTLQAWIDQGKPEGDAASAPPIDVWVPSSLDRVDLELRTAGPRAPALDDGNEYRCYLLGTMDETTYATGIEFLIDHPEISHHALLLLDADGGNEGSVTDPASQSWDCGLADMPGDILHAWAPSNGAAAFPEGTGLRLPAGSQLVLQMHYFQGAAVIPEDQPGYALRLSPTVDRELFYVPLGPDRFTVPAGDPAYTLTSAYPLQFLLGPGIGIDVFGVFPHMHLLGTAYDFHARHPDESETCISRADQYDFSMQPTYWFDEPIHLASSDVVSVSCTWDNSADNPLQVNDPPVDVTWGENTQQEMCYAFLYAAIE